LDTLESLIFSLESEADILGLAGLRPQNQLLIRNLWPLLECANRRSSFEVLLELKSLNRREKVELAMNLGFFSGPRGNRIQAYEGLLSCILREGADPVDLATRLLARNEKRLRYDDEARVKALMNVCEETGLIEPKLLDVLQQLLDLQMETFTRLYMMKFLYRHTKDERILDEAERWESKKIREWARQQREERLS